MRRFCLVVYALCLVAATSSRASQAASDTSVAPARGITVLASDIGTTYSPEGLADFVKQGKFSPVIVDWAWITYHWGRTDFEAVNRFLDLMAKRHVPVAAMYRPRFLNKPTVPIQVDKDGKPAFGHGSYICFSSPEARRWGIAWGTRILQNCPRISEVIIYNPINICKCSACQEAAQNNPYAQYDVVWQFLAEAKETWRKQKRSVKLGVVHVTDPEFWKRGAEVLDLAHPFLIVDNEVNFEKDTADARAIRDLLPGKVGPYLAKVTWEPEITIPAARLAEFDRIATRAGLPYVFWTFDTLFVSSLHDPAEVSRTLGLDPEAMTGAIGRMQQRSP